MIHLEKGNWSDAIYALLEEELRIGNRLVCFDFDNTLIYNDFGEEIMKSILQDGLINLKEDFSKFFENPIQAEIVFKNKKDISKYVLLEYDRQFEKFGLEAAYRWTSFIFSGWKDSEFREYSLSVWKKLISEKKIYIYPQMQNLIEALQKANCEVFIVTASPESAIQSIVHNLNLKEEHVLGMRLEMIDSISTPNIIEPYTCKKGKVNAILEKTNRYPHLSFGDSINDLEMLTASQNGIYLNRGDKKMLELVELQNNIHIQKIFYD